MKLQQQCDYIILFPEVNEMQKPRVALALLYTYLSTLLIESRAPRALFRRFGLALRVEKSH